MTGRAGTERRQEPPVSRAHEKRCGGRLPGLRCRLRSGHAGKHSTFIWTWNNRRDPVCFWCGKPAQKKVRMVSGVGRAQVCADFVRISKEHYPNGIPYGFREEGKRCLGICGQGCRVTGYGSESCAALTQAAVAATEKVSS